MKNNFFNMLFKRECLHKNALLSADEGYCPDCGKYLKKNYYLIRCSCCDIKREAKISWGEILPLNTYCPNCGTKEYYIEKLDSINLIDANFAIYLKEEAVQENVFHAQTQIWVEKEQQKRLSSDILK